MELSASIHYRGSHKFSSCLVPDFLLISLYLHHFPTLSHPIKFIFPRSIPPRAPFHTDTPITSPYFPPPATYVPQKTTNPPYH